jgi:rhamnosyltransferase
MEREIAIQNGFKVSLLIPTYNAGDKWGEALKSINDQQFLFYQKIIVDSDSKDNTVELAKTYGFEVINIPQAQFNHGATRQLLIEKAADADIALFMTQDAILAGNTSVGNLIASFDDQSVALAYGRQLPHINAMPLEKHARLYNYPETSHVRSIADKAIFGFKTIFCSNSFAAYRLTALNEAAGFPLHSIMGEDTLTAAKLLSLDYKIAYVADAMVHHSHDYTFQQEFRRFFDTRVFHEQNKWLVAQFGNPTGEGKRYVVSELKFILKNYPTKVFKIFTSTLAKWLGYHAGRYYAKIPRVFLKKMSMHASYWK